LDGDGITNLEEVQNGTNALVYNIHVFPGWNLIHLPRALSRSSVDLDDLFGEGGGNYFSWDAADGVYTQVTQVTPGTGVWVYWRLPDEVLELPGEKVAEITLDIQQGWNLVGVPFPVDATVLDEYARVLWCWDVTTQRYRAIVTGNLENGVGYWLFATSPVSLTIQDQ
jgi:hypothetical protein